MAGETKSTIVSFNNAHNFITIKLTNTNYRFWKTQITLYLEGLNLMGYVDGTHQRPPPTDPNYAQWVEQDKLIMSLLVASLSEEAFPIVNAFRTGPGGMLVSPLDEEDPPILCGRETSHDIWTTLEKARADGLLKGKDKRSLADDVRKAFDTQLIVATLVATVTFAAGFTLPGGYDSKEGPNQGMAVLARNAAFQAFVVSDTIAVIFSLIAVFLHFVATIYGVEDAQQAIKLYIGASLVIVIAMIAMTFAFIMGLYTVLAHLSLGLAISICFFGSFCILIFLWVLYRFIRFVLGKVRRG